MPLRLFCQLRPFRLISLFGLILLCTTARADPPERVGRLSDIQGVVTLRQSGVDDTQQALVNWPITSGHMLRTEPGAFAELSLGAASFRLAGDTDLTILQFDDRHIRLQLHGGSVQVRVPTANLAREIELDTAQGHILFSEPANVRIDSGSTGRDRFPTTAISVVSGSASFDGGNTRFAVSAGRRAEVDGTGLLSMAMRNATRDDDFDRWNQVRDRYAQQLAQRGTSRYLSSDIAGYEVLESYGNWRTTSEYGPLWSPSVLPVGWAPYRDGRWTWIAPWGWTWVDQAPWGYAPSHYGRWVFYDQRWYWTPGGVTTRSVWAPAVVGWVGGSGWQVAGNSGPAVAWFPLAPREPYMPAYQATPRYVQQINNAININGAASLPLRRPPDGRAALYQNQQVGNAVTAVPSYQFGVNKTVLVPSAVTRGDAPNSAFAVPITTLPQRSQAPLNAVPQLQRAQPFTDVTTRSNRGTTLVTVSPATAPLQTPTPTMSAPRQIPSPMSAPPASRNVEPSPATARTGASLAFPPAGSPVPANPAAARSRSQMVEANGATPDPRFSTNGGGSGRFEPGTPRDGFGRGGLQR